MKIYCNLCHSGGRACLQQAGVQISACPSRVPGIGGVYPDEHRGNI